MKIWAYRLIPGVWTISNARVYSYRRMKKNSTKGNTAYFGIHYNKCIGINKGNVFPVDGSVSVLLYNRRNINRHFLSPETIHSVPPTLNVGRKSVS